MFISDFAICRPIITIVTMITPTPIPAGADPNADD